MAQSIETSPTLVEQRARIHLDELEEGKDDEVMIMGNVIQCTAKNNIAHCFIPRLIEGSVYLIGNFQVIRNKEEYRVLKDNPLMIELQGPTYLRRQVGNDNLGFIRHPYSCIDFEDLEVTGGKYLVDNVSYVIGYALNVGKPKDQKSGATTLDFELANERGKKLPVTLWGNLGHFFVQKISEHNGLHTSALYCVILSLVTVKTNRSGNLSISSSSSTLIMDDPEIPALQAFKSKVSGKALAEVLEDCLAEGQLGSPKEGTLAELLDLARQRKYSAADTFKCTLHIANVRTKSSWYYFSCGICSYRKGISRQGNQFWCVSYEKEFPYPTTRFRLQFDVTDDSAATVTVLFDETVEQIVNGTAQSLLTDMDKVFTAGPDHPDSSPGNSGDAAAAPATSSLAKTAEVKSSTPTGQKRNLHVATPAKELERPRRRKFVVESSDSEDGKTTVEAK
ncbi:replication protein A 70 kDa DNA-binding subunit B-like [Rutidosis leptorrhynchoides]|uniref:replication protein A 70 kDa DNA-binding subunit B-like n=1 Tax=Rutidosis leptorrhynchoides TaxID=125765 RepID=UPI003A9920F1